jgi:ribosomal protein S18 acetylase RimI-like enzyme
MILLPTEKTEEMFEKVHAISDESFAGVERPPIGLFRIHFDRDDVFVSSINSVVVAFAIVEQRSSEGRYIWSIAVTAKYRGCGIGTDLLEQITRRYRRLGHGSIGLSCKVDNPAQKLYFDCGYRVERVAKRYYGDEGDGLLMRRVL